MQTDIDMNSSMKDNPLTISEQGSECFSGQLKQKRIRKKLKSAVKTEGSCDNYLAPPQAEVQKQRRSASPSAVGIAGEVVFAGMELGSVGLGSGPKEGWGVNSSLERSPNKIADKEHPKGYRNSLVFAESISSSVNDDKKDRIGPLNFDSFPSKSAEILNEKEPGDFTERSSTLGKLFRSTRNYGRKKAKSVTNLLEARAERNLKPVDNTKEETMKESMQKKKEHKSHLVNEGNTNIPNPLANNLKLEGENRKKQRSSSQNLDKSQRFKRRILRNRNPKSQTVVNVPQVLVQYEESPSLSRRHKSHSPVSRSQKTVKIDDHENFVTDAYCKNSVSKSCDELASSISSNEFGFHNLPTLSSLLNVRPEENLGRNQRKSRSLLRLSFSRRKSKQAEEVNKLHSDDNLRREQVVSKFLTPKFFRKKANNSNWPKNVTSLNPSGDLAKSASSLRSTSPQTFINDKFQFLQSWDSISSSESWSSHSHPSYVSENFKRSFSIQSSRSSHDSGKTNSPKWDNSTLTSNKPIIKENIISTDRTQVKPLDVTAPLDVEENVNTSNLEFTEEREESFDTPDSAESGSYHEAKDSFNNITELCKPISQSSIHSSEELSCHARSNSSSEILSNDDSSGNNEKRQRCDRKEESEESSQNKSSSCDLSDTCFGDISGNVSDANRPNNKVVDEQLAKMIEAKFPPLLNEKNNVLNGNHCEDIPIVRDGTENINFLKSEKTFIKRHLDGSDGETSDYETIEITFKNRIIDYFEKNSGKTEVEMAKDDSIEISPASTCSRNTASSRESQASMDETTPFSVAKSCDVPTVTVTSADCRSSKLNGCHSAVLVDLESQSTILVDIIEGEDQRASSTLKSDYFIQLPHYEDPILKAGLEIESSPRDLIEFSPKREVKEQMLSIPSSDSKPSRPDTPSVELNMKVNGLGKPISPYLGSAVSPNRQKSPSFQKDNYHDQQTRHVLDKVKSSISNLTNYIPFNQDKVNNGSSTKKDMTHLTHFQIENNENLNLSSTKSDSDIVDSSANEAKDESFLNKDLQMKMLPVKNTEDYLTRDQGVHETFDCSTGPKTQEPRSLSHFQQQLSFSNSEDSWDRVESLAEKNECIQPYKIFEKLNCMTFSKSADELNVSYKPKQKKEIRESFTSEWLNQPEDQLKWQEMWQQLRKKQRQQLRSRNCSTILYDNSSSDENGFSKSQKYHSVAGEIMPRSSFPSPHILDRSLSKHRPISCSDYSNDGNLTMQTFTSLSPVSFKIIDDYSLGFSSNVTNRVSNLTHFFDSYMLNKSKNIGHKRIERGPKAHPLIEKAVMMKSKSLDETELPRNSEELVLKNSGTQTETTNLPSQNFGSETHRAESVEKKRFEMVSTVSHDDPSTKFDISILTSSPRKSFFNLKNYNNDNEVKNSRSLKKTKTSESYGHCKTLPNNWRKNAGTDTRDEGKGFFREYEMNFQSDDDFLKKLARVVNPNRPNAVVCRADLEEYCKKIQSESKFDLSHRNLHPNSINTGDVNESQLLKPPDDDVNQSIASETLGRRSRTNSFKQSLSRWRSHSSFRKILKSPRENEGPKSSSSNDCLHESLKKESRGRKRSSSMNSVKRSSRSSSHGNRSTLGSLSDKNKCSKGTEIGLPESKDLPALFSEENWPAKLPSKTIKRSLQHRMSSLLLSSSRKVLISIRFGSLPCLPLYGGVKYQGKRPQI